MMRADTQTTTIAADAAEVHAYLADPANLPAWAIRFAQGIRREGDRWLVLSNGIELPIRYEADPRRGTIDLHFEPVPGAAAAVYTRVVPNGAGAEYVFTHFQGPGMPDEVFAATKAALSEELARLPALFADREGQRR